VHKSAEKCFLNPNWRSDTENIFKTAIGTQISTQGKSKKTTQLFGGIELTINHRGKILTLFLILKAHTGLMHKNFLYFLLDISWLLF